VELHEGTVTAHSEGIGCGSAFTVSLPRLSQPNERRTTFGIAPTTSPRRVLVVDDNLDALESLRDYLVHQGHDVVASSQPFEALEIARQFQPQLAVLDIGLPGMDGYTLASMLRASFTVEQLRLVAVTGYGQTKDFERSKAAGFDTHLVKPVALDDLDAALAGA